MKMENPPFYLNPSRNPINIRARESHYNQASHPDIIEFTNGFKGALKETYKYIMVMTPYPHYDERYENPCIVVSNDLSYFVEDNILNPVEPYPGEDYHNSDPDIVYVNGSFHLFWRLRQTSNNKGWIFLKKSEDLVNWSDKRLCNILPAPLSPAVLYDIHENIWKLWGVIEGDWHVAYYESEDGLNWTLVDHTTIPNYINWMGLKRNCWHLDVSKTLLSKSYLALIVYASGAGGDAPSYLFYGESDDGIDWKVYKHPVLSPIPKSWQSSKIYRSTFIVKDGQIQVWYSAASSGTFLRRLNIRLFNRKIGCGKWGIGYSEASIDFVSRKDISLNVVR